MKSKEEFNEAIIEAYKKSNYRWDEVAAEVYAESVAEVEREVNGLIATLKAAHEARESEMIASNAANHFRDRLVLADKLAEAGHELYLGASHPSGCHSNDSGAKVTDCDCGLLSEEAEWVSLRDAFLSSREGVGEKAPQRCEAQPWLDTGVDRFCGEPMPCVKHSGVGEKEPNSALHSTRCPSHGGLACNCTGYVPDPTAQPSEDPVLEQVVSDARRDALCDIADKLGFDGRGGDPTRILDPVQRLRERISRSGSALRKIADALAAYDREGGE